MRKFGRIMVFGMILVLAGLITGCGKSEKWTLANTEEVEKLASEKTAGKYLIIEGVDIIRDQDGKIFFRPVEGNYKYYYEERLLIEEGYKLFTDILPGEVVKNVRKAILLINGENVSFLYYVPTPNIVSLDYLEYNSTKGQAECRDSEDCYDLFGDPPDPFIWVCREGTCVYGLP